MNQPSGLLSLPPSVLKRLHTFVLGFETVEIEVDEQGVLLTSTCRLLRVCKQLRHELLAACRRGELQLVHTVRSPEALSCLLSTTATSTVLPVRTLRCVLLAKLEGVNLTEQEQYGWGGGPRISPLFKGWRKSFQSLPTDATVELVYFDLVRSFRVKIETLAGLINCLSAILRQRSGGQAKCRILGSWTTHGQKYFENSAVNVIGSNIDLRGKKPNPSRESPPEEFSNRRTFMEEVDAQPRHVQANI